MYTILIKSGVVSRDSDGAQVIPSMNPNNPNDSLVREYLEWVRRGNAPTPDYRDPDEVLLANAKDTRLKVLENLKVTAPSGRVYDGDLESQTRIATALATMDSTDTIKWVLADNSVAEVNRDELFEVLRAMRLRTTEIWVLPPVSALRGRP